MFIVVQRSGWVVGIAVTLIMMLMQLHIVESGNSSNNNTFDYYVKTYLSHGTMNNAYLTYDEYIDFLNMIEYTFPNTTTLDSIGYTFNNNSIPLLTISNKKFQMYYQN